MRPELCRKCGSNDWREVDGKRRCRVCQKISQQEHRRQHPYVTLHDGAKRRARRDKVPFSLTTDDVREILSSWSCSYCEAPVGSFHGGSRPNSATLDRIIPTEGYTRANTTLACHRCNTVKGEHTPTSLRDWADRIDAVLNRQNQKAI